MAVGVDRWPNICSITFVLSNRRSVVHDSIAHYILRNPITFELYREKIIEMELYRKSYKNPREGKCVENVMHKIVGVEMVSIG